MKKNIWIPLVSILLVIVIGVGGFLFWNQYKEKPAALTFGLHVWTELHAKVQDISFEQNVLSFQKDGEKFTFEMKEKEKSDDLTIYEGQDADQKLNCVYMMGETKEGSIRVNRMDQSPPQQVKDTKYNFTVIPTTNGQKNKVKEELLETVKETIEINKQQFEK